MNKKSTAGEKVDLIWKHCKCGDYVLIRKMEEGLCQKCQAEPKKEVTLSKP